MVRHFVIADRQIDVEYSEGATIMPQVLGKYTPFEVSTALPDSILKVVLIEHISLLEKMTLLEEMDEEGCTIHLYQTLGGTYFLKLRSGTAEVLGVCSSSWHELDIQVIQGDCFAIPLIDRLVMIAFSMAIQPLGYLKVHASVIEFKRQALVFMGVSGTGKSTHSRLWLEYISGCSLLNDDEPIIRLMPDSTIRVYGCPWSGSTPCYRNVYAEVKAFVLLRQAPSNELKRLSGQKAFEALFSSCAVISCFPHSQRQVFNTACSILEHLPVYQLDNLPNRDAVTLSHSLLD